MNTTRHRHGLIIGKFYPPHLGHNSHIDTAAAQVDRLTVVVMGATNASVTLDERVAWLSEIHNQPNVTIASIRCDAPEDYYSEVHWVMQVALMKAAVAAVTDEPVDAVFTSESYGEELARRFSATHVSVDPYRSIHRTSGTDVRGNLAEYWTRLHPVVRRGLTTRIVVVGAESTGTTTVSKALAEHYRTRGGVWEDTGWVPEYGRDYTYIKQAAAEADAEAAGAPAPSLDELVWTSGDFAHIAATQTEMENAAAETGSPVLFCDTDAFATSVWEYRYMGPDSHGADEAAADLPPRTVYLLTDHVGVPFEDDGWRDGEHLRADMTRWFIQRLTEAGHSWVLLTGTLEDRMQIAVEVTEMMLGLRADFTDPISHIPTVLAPLP